MQQQDRFLARKVPRIPRSGGRSSLSSSQSGTSAMVRSADIPMAQLASARSPSTRSPSSERIACVCEGNACLNPSCECFATGGMCAEFCSCKGCSNNKEHTAERLTAIQTMVQMIGSQNKKCNCKNSRCLQKYCECFSSLQRCSSQCNCRNCLNNQEHEPERNQAIQASIRRDPFSFLPKILPSPVTSDSNAPRTPVSVDVLHFRGCKCKKSNCLKKYCECFEAGVACGPNCRCFDCKNHVSTEHSRTPSQRSSEVSNPVVMQIANGSSRSYSHSSVPMRVPSTVGSGKRRRESSPVAIVSEDVGVQQRNAVDIDSKFPRVLEEQFFSHRFNHVNSTPGFKSLLQDVIDPEVVIMFCKKLVDVVKKEEMLNTVRSDKQAAEGLLFLASLNPEKEIATDSLRQNTRNELGNLQPDDDSLVCTEDYIDDNQSDETIDDEDLKQRSKELFQRQEALILLETDRFLKNLISMAQRRPQYRLERESNSLSLGSQNSAFRKAK